MSVLEKAMWVRGITLPVVVAVSWMIFPLWLGLSVLECRQGHDEPLAELSEGTPMFEDVGFGWRVRQLEGPVGAEVRERGLGLGDIVVAIDEHKDIGSAEELLALLRRDATVAWGPQGGCGTGVPTGGISVDVYRDGKPMRLVALTHDNGVTNVIEIKGEHAREEAEHHGAHFVLTLGTDMSTQGYSLHDIGAGSVFDQAGAHEGDVLVTLMGTDVTKPGKLHDAVHRAESSILVRMTVLRDGEQKTLVWDGTAPEGSGCSHHDTILD